MSTTRQEIEKLDWSLEQSNAYMHPSYRAQQGHFKTQWRTTTEQVLADVRAIKQAREEVKPI